MTYSITLIFNRNYKLFILAVLIIDPDIKQAFRGKNNVNIILSISLNISFGCPKEPSHGDGSFEYP